jgi:hypothetical protein
MIDILLLADLVVVLDAGTRLVLVGNVDQWGQLGTSSTVATPRAPARTRCAST